ncbi:MAG TPA: CHRD domain-containing protein, partial [Pyrinomonadaceae bacterium]|nr:CHRD domain-containing protein [Pyrinomonadaceae bacterium]
MKLFKNFTSAISVFSLIAAFSLAARAETTFTGTLNAAQEIPTNNSAAVGFGRVTLNDAETQITFSLTFSGLSSNQTASHIHNPGPPGVNAPVLFNIGSTGMTSGTFRGLTQPVTAAQVADLKAGKMYFNVHSTTFPGGEIRGQILVDSPFVANFSGSQEVPANNSAGTGLGKVSLNANETQIVASFNFADLGSNAVAGHIHNPALPGVNASVLFPMPPPSSTSGAVVDLFFAVTPQQAADLKRGLLYFNIHTSM